MTVKEHDKHLLVQSNYLDRLAFTVFYHIDRGACQTSYACTTTCPLRNILLYNGPQYVFYML